MGASERDSGKWTDTSCLLSTFPKLFRLVVAISSLFLIRISCHKTTHANGYYGAWPGWAVSISVLPLIQGLSCFEVYGIFPDQGLNRGPLHCKVDS